MYEDKYRAEKYACNLVTEELHITSLTNDFIKKQMQNKKA